MILSIENNTLQEEILRAFILSSCLEPLGEKPGCTTRTIDSTLGTKLKYFIISAVNSATSINRLVSNLLDKYNKKFSIFKYAYEAQFNSTRNRMGGKVNYAQILMLLPIINAQCIMYLEGIKYRKIDILLKKASEYMLNTNEVDVKYLQKFVNLSIKQSQEHNIKINKERIQLFPIFEGRYKNIAEAIGADKFSHTMMSTEIRNGYPECKKIYYELNSKNSSKKIDLIEQSEKIYPKYLKEYKRHDVAADNIVIGFYLTLINKKNDKIFL